MSYFLFFSPAQQKSYFLSIFNSMFEQIGPNFQIFEGESIRDVGSTNLGHEHFLPFVGANLIGWIARTEKF